MLQERFSAFSHDTVQTGSERVSDANKLSDDLINIGHSDADQISNWKDMINNAWEDLLELISTREEVIHNHTQQCSDYYPAVHMFNFQKIDCDAETKTKYHERKAHEN